MGMLRHIGNNIPYRRRNNLVRGLIHSRLAYLLPLWGGASDSLLSKAQIVLNVAARWTTGLNKRTKVSDLMTATGWLNIKEQVRLATAINTWKVINYSKPQRLRDRYEITEQKLIEIQGPRLKFSNTCYRWRAAADWNHLSQDLRNETSIGAFKRRMRRLVLDDRESDLAEHNGD